MRVKGVGSRTIKGAARRGQRKMEHESRLARNKRVVTECYAKSKCRVAQGIKGELQ